MSLRYHYLSWLRRGAVAHLAADAAGTARASIKAEVEVFAEGMEGAPDRTDKLSRDIQLFGPGDVCGFDAAAVLAAEPPGGTGDCEPNYLCAVRFHAGDFPWRFSPRVADLNGNLMPWIVLVVLTREEAKNKVPGGDSKAPPCVKVDATLLPKLGDSWRWAHAQVVHDADVNEAELKRLLQEEPHRVTSRLLCARRLQPNMRYEAFVVPAFAAGVAAATGNAAGDTVAPAWADDAQGQITLPYYYRWEFGTGAAGDFEAMARRLAPFNSGELEIGIRAFDAGNPGFGIRAAGLQLKLEGAIRSPQPAGHPALGSLWGHDAAPPSAGVYHERLALVLNQPFVDLKQRDPSAPDPVVGPPIYGRWHAARSTVQAPAAGASLSAHWVDQLNLDPRHRAAAGLGALVAEKYQEAFMASAWRQIGEVERANQLIRNAQLAREAGAHLHRRFSGMSPERKSAFLAPAAKRILGAEKMQTLAARVGSHGTVKAALDPAFRRMARSRGPLARHQSAAKRRAAGALVMRLQADKPFRPAGAAPAPKGAQTWSAVSMRVAAADATATPIGVREADLHASLGANIKRLAGTPLGARYGTQPQIDQLAASVVETLAGFLSPGDPDDKAKASPVNDFAAEFERPILGALDPEKSIVRKITSRLPGRGKLPAGADQLSPILAAPDFPQPMYEELRGLSQQFLMPGAEKVPENVVTVLEMNRRFVEAYLAGLNHAFAGELRWREYPTDQRGSSFRQFWDVSRFAATEEERERYRDIRRMHQWTGRLGANGMGQVTNPAMVLIRGDLLRRYPNTLVYVVEADTQGKPIPASEAKPALEPIFGATLPPDMFFFGFNMEPARLKTGGQAGKGHFVVLEECVGDTRFGADEATTPLQGCAPDWNKLSWAYIRTSGASGYINSTPCATRDDSVKWDSSADVAWILQQWPMRVYMHAARLLP